MRRLTVVLTLGLLGCCVACGSFWFLFPNFGRRPMFNYWAGISAGGWVRDVFLRDDLGTVVYFDLGHEIIVILINHTERISPLRTANSKQATFSVKDIMVTVSTADKEKLIVLDDQGGRKETSLLPGEAASFRDQLIELSASDSLLDQIRILYEMKEGRKFPE